MSVWLLPENIADMLPREARAIEHLRSSFLKLVTSHGFEVVRPPLVEYVDSLLTGTGGDLDLRTFKIVDQVTGKTMGRRRRLLESMLTFSIVRVYPASAMLEAFSMHVLCILLLRASRTWPVLKCSALPVWKSEREVICLGIESLRQFGLENIFLDLGHTGVVKAILDSDPASEAVQDQILFALSHKDRSALEELRGVLKEKTVDDLIRLTMLFGSEDVLNQVIEEFSDYPEIPEILESVRRLGRESGADIVSYDFADVAGYSYHTGVTFSVNIPGRYQPILRGGRYDDIGERFGRKRPAVGFTLYLREIIAVMDTKRPYAILAPNRLDDAALQSRIRELRENGDIVIEKLPEDNVASLEESFRLDEELVCINGVWTVAARTSNR